MVEWIDIISNLSLVLTGAFSSLFITLILEYMRSRAKKRKIAKLLIANIGNQILNMQDIINIYLELHDAKNSDEITRLINNIENHCHKDNTQQILLLEMATLPGETLKRILDYYYNSRTTLKRIKKSIKLMDKDKILVDTDKIYSLLDHANIAIASLHKNIFKDYKEANGYLTGLNSKEFKDISNLLEKL